MGQMEERNGMALGHEREEYYMGGSRSRRSHLLLLLH